MTLLNTLPLGMVPLAKVMPPTPLAGVTPSALNGAEPIVNAPPLVLREKPASGILLPVLLPVSSPSKNKFAPVTVLAPSQPTSATAPALTASALVLLIEV